MAAPDEALVYRAGGTLWLSPTSVTPPGFGSATQLGVTHHVKLSPVVRQFNITSEEFGGEVVEGVNMGRDWVLTALIRGYDADSLGAAGWYSNAAGSSSGKPVLSEPGGIAIGSLLTGGAVKLLFAPFNTAHPGFIAYRALPNLQSLTKINFSIKRDWSYIATFRLVRDSSGRHLKQGLVEDLSI
jgi:hypothetical protein